jgi:hypothetical protein
MAHGTDLDSALLETAEEHPNVLTFCKLRPPFNAKALTV